MQTGEPTTPVPAAAEATSDAAAAPTPLDQRQWQRLAQRAVRLAVTAFKDGATRFTDASARGTTEATQLTNSLLSQRYMPDLKLPDVLRQVAGLQAAAAAKLHRQQLQHLEQLKELLGEMETAVQDMHSALEGVTIQLTAGSSRWQSNLPVFHCLALPESASLLQQVLQLHSQELAVKQDLLRCFEDLVYEAGNCLQDSSVAAGLTAAKHSNSRRRSRASSGFGLQRRAVRSVEDCRKLLTGGITTWMVRPCIEDERVDQLLQVLTGEMVGF